MLYCAAVACVIFSVFGCQYQCNRLVQKSRHRNDMLCAEWDIIPYCILAHYFVFYFFHWYLCFCVTNKFNLIRFDLMYEGSSTSHSDSVHRDSDTSGILFSTVIVSLRVVHCWCETYQLFVVYKRNVISSTAVYQLREPCTGLIDPSCQENFFRRYSLQINVFV